MVRVLFVYNTAGALTSVADWLSNNGHESRILMTWPDDPYELTSKSPNAIMVKDSEAFFIELKKQIVGFRPTHIHVNGTYNGLAVARALAPLTPIVFQYHGDDVRGRLYPHLRVSLICDKIIVSTADLAQYGEWYDCPVSEQFYYRGNRETGTALTILPPTIHFDFEKQCIKYAKMMNLRLTVVDCRKGERILHSEMPEFLSKFEYYLDFKGVRVLGALSLVAKEAYAVGCKVIHDSNLSGPVKGYKPRTGEDFLALYQGVKSLSPWISAARLMYCLPRSLPYLY